MGLLLPKVDANSYSSIKNQFPFYVTS